MFYPREEGKVGKIKFIMRKVVICALDLNVLSSCSLHEQGWETRLGTLKVSGLCHKKIKFLKISDRAWWLEVLVLKTPRLRAFHMFKQQRM